MAQPGHQAIEPGPRHLEIFEAVCTRSDATADLVPDAFLAAVAIENAATGSRSTGTSLASTGWTGSSPPLPDTGLGGRGGHRYSVQLVHGA